eukprot:5542238-Amphidinium_carterae.1
MTDSLTTEPLRLFAHSGHYLLLMRLGVFVKTTASSVARSGSFWSRGNMRRYTEHRWTTANGLLETLPFPRSLQKRTNTNNSLNTALPTPGPAFRNAAKCISKFGPIVNPVGWPKALDIGREYVSNRQADSHWQ